MVSVAALQSASGSDIVGALTPINPQALGKLKDTGII
jgi:hypothetical protein